MNNLKKRQSYEFLLPRIFDLFLINAPFRKFTGAVYRIFLGLYWAFIGEGRLKGSGRLLEKIRYGWSQNFPNNLNQAIFVDVQRLHENCK